MTTGVVIAAAGSGERLGAAGPKALVLLHGVSLLQRSLRAFLNHPLIGPIVVALPPDVDHRHAVGETGDRVRVVTGGATRQASVFAGLQALPPVDIILVHDAARPLVSAAVISAVIAGAERAGAAAPVLPVSDTVRRRRKDGFSAGTVERQALVATQTPQGFHDALLRRAHHDARSDGYEATDDAALVERLGGTVLCVPGETRNIKITTADDLRLAEALLRASGGGDVHG